MEGPSRNVIVNEDDTRKVEVYTQGDVDVTPTGIPIMASDAGGTIRILKQDNAGNLNVNIQAGGAGNGAILDGVDSNIKATVLDYVGSNPVAVRLTDTDGNYIAGAGGGPAQIQVKNGAGTDTAVGFAAGNMNVPVECKGAGGSISVSIAGSSGSMGVYLDAINQTISARVGQVDGTVAVYFSPSLPTIKGVNDSISVHILSTNGTMGVRFSDEPYVVAEGKYGVTKAPLIVNTDGALKIYDIVNGTVQVSGITNSIGVYLDTWRQTGAVRVGQVDGTVAVYFSQSNPKVNLGTDIINIGHTASVASAGGSVSGSTSGVSVSGVQIVAPVASRVIKVYAVSLMTTAQSHLSPRFTNGAGTGPAEYWRGALQAPAQGISGFNLAVTPPGYLFATASGATLCLVLDSASLVHYSIAYFRETA